MKILVTRFSSIGDVALTVPLLQALVLQYPDLEVIMLSRPQFQSLFQPLNLTFVGARLEAEHRGIKGLFRLKKEITKEFTPDLVVDLHDVLRTHILRRLFAVSGSKVSAIDKGRRQKKLLTRKVNKVFSPLPHTLERYQAAFAKVGIYVSLDIAQPELPYYQSGLADKAWASSGIGKNSVGFAPLAAHIGKTWPLKHTEKLLADLGESGMQVVLFGGSEDRALLADLTEGRSHVHLAPTTLGFGAEIAFMKNLKMMISMDSANMHLAALAGIPVVSIWGATHPFAGFSPVGQPADRMIGIGADELTCRPCSVYGNKPCFRKDYACLNRLSAAMVMKKITAVTEQI